MSIIFLFWLHVIKPMIQTSNEVDSELQLIDQLLHDSYSIGGKNYPSANNYIREAERMLPEDFIY